MNNQHATCDSRRIEDFLEGMLPPSDQQALESHLNHCTACRGRLDSTAAGTEFWEESSAFLRPDPLDVEASSLHSPPRTGSDFLLATDEPVADRPEVSQVARYLDPTDDPRMLGRFGGYEIVGIVGCGGMGIVLKGYESTLDRYVAIKVLAPHLSTSGAARARFAREARAAAAVLHDNVVAIHRVAEANGLPYLVMPYLAGESLQKRLDERGRLELVEVLRIARQVAAGLAAANAQGLVHRDVKPANVLLDRGVERVVLTDFGLARAADDASLTRSGVIAGTPQYMSPEQARGESIDARSDLFSLGSLIYAMCTGRPPFRAESAYGVLRRICETQPHPLRDLAPEMPSWLCEIVERLHAKQPADRYASAEEVTELLGRWLAHVQQPTVVPAPRDSGRKRTLIRRIRTVKHPGWIAAVAIAVAMLTLLVTWSLPEGGASAQVQTQSPNLAAQPNAVVATRGPMQPLIDEQSLLDEYSDIRERAAGIEESWQNSEETAFESWERSATELHRRIDEIARRIERYEP